jgi:hypothetical protein
LIIPNPENLGKLTFGIRNHSVNFSLNSIGAIDRDGKMIGKIINDINEPDEHILSLKLEEDEKIVSVKVVEREVQTFWGKVMQPISLQFLLADLLLLE